MSTHRNLTVYVEMILGNCARAREFVSAHSNVDGLAKGTKSLYAIFRALEIRGLSAEESQRQLEGVE